jgi:uncharacterized repeat protein (TIGR03803 family)
MKFSSHPARMILTLMLVPMFMLGGTANAAGHGYKTVYRFQGGSDGSLPIGVPAADKDGNLYGVTSDGGTNGWGTIFKLTAPQTRGGKWTKTVLYNATGQNQGYPCFITIDARGVLYGTGCGQETTGFIWELTPPLSGDGAWTYTVLYALNGHSDGSHPTGKVVFDGEGNLYGATVLGGDGCLPTSTCGTVFELKRPTKKGGKWHFQVLHTFTGQPDGAQPFAGVTFDATGNLYGTTWEGGSYGWGAVYRISPPKKKGQGWKETVLYSFDTANYDIISPEGPVAFDTSGNLYGTTPLGGDLNCQGGYGCGVVFELAPPREEIRAWTYTTLYEFQGSNDGIDPQGYMVFDSQENLYSTTYGGGKTLGGTAFRLSPSGGSWTETELHWFPENKKDGSEPAEGLTWGKWGDLYGVAPYGGGTGCYFGCGTVFELQP